MPARRRRSKRREEIPPEVIAYFRDEEGPHPVRYFWGEKRLRAAWEELGAGIVEEFAREQPGTRPAHWWRWSAPEHRRRLGGIGTPAHECTAHAPWHEFGVPVIFVTERMVEGFNLVRRPGEPLWDAGTPLDPAWPPLYESQASFLRRRNLLLLGEEKRLGPQDFEPEPIVLEEGDA